MLTSLSRGDISTKTLRHAIPCTYSMNSLKYEMIEHNTHFGVKSEDQISDNQNADMLDISLECPKPKCKFLAKNKQGLSSHLTRHKDCPYCEETFYGSKSGTV